MVSRLPGFQQVTFHPTPRTACRPSRRSVYLSSLPSGGAVPVASLIEV